MLSKSYFVKEKDYAGKIQYFVFYGEPAPRYGPDPRSLRTVLDIVELTPEEYTKTLKQLEHYYTVKRLKSK